MCTGRCFLRSANRYSNTVNVLATYLGETKGSVSQTVQLLERRGYVRRKPDSSDRRVTRLELTPAGKRLASEIEADSSWDEAIRRMPGESANTASAALITLLRHWQQEHDGATFGVCRSCAYFQTEGSEQFRCSLTQGPLNLFDSGQICSEHRFHI